MAACFVYSTGVCRHTLCLARRMPDKRSHPRGSLAAAVTGCCLWFSADHTSRAVLTAMVFEAGLLICGECKGVKEGCPTRPTGGFLGFVLAPLRVCPGFCRERLREVGTPHPPSEHTCFPTASYAVFCKPPTLAPDSGSPYCKFSALQRYLLFLALLAHRQSPFP